MRFLPVNLDALLVELDDLPQTLALLASLQVTPIDGIVELVPAARTLMVRFRPTTVSHDDLVARIGGRSLTAPVERARTRVEIPVDYQGEDLDEVAQMLGLSREEVIRRHTGSDYTVAFTGFAPGFAYLSGGDTSLNVPRRTTPRTRIPAGAVGLAGEFSGVYPQASPGGWQIIGVTATPMWDLAREVPALLQPGFRVRFVDVSGQGAVALGKGTEASAAPQSRLLQAGESVVESSGQTPVEPSGKVALQAPVEASGPAPGQTSVGTPHEPHDGAALRIVSTGLQALFQDTGRHGQAGQGVSASGAMDQGALRAANRLVGNASDAACIEIVYGGFQLVSQGETVVAFTGADAPLVLTSAGVSRTSNERTDKDTSANTATTSPTGARCQVASHTAIALSDGDSLTLGEPRAGIRSYLAVRGGFVIALVLGSRSTDTLAQVGPPHLKAGDVLPVQAVTRGAIVGGPEVPRADLPTTQHTVVLDVVMGPRTDWFTPEAVALLASQLWTVTPQSNRVGLRLSGDAPLTRALPAELPSEGTALGAIQVPPSGQPVLFLADHPLTGGYPVIGAVASHHLDRAGQIPIGARVRFNPVRAFSASTNSAPPDSR